MQIGTDYINDESDAASFYYAVIVENGVVIDADRGFFRSNGEPALEGLPIDQLQELQDCHIKARTILADNNVDAQEIINFCESLLVIRIVTGNGVTPEECPANVIKDFANEPKERKEHRRWSHLWNCFMNTLEQCVDGFVYDERSAGVAIPKDAHPVLEAYIRNCTQRLPCDTYTEAINSDATKQDIKNSLRKKARSLGKSVKEIDPDSDENDDDPFSSGMWA